MPTILDEHQQWLDSGGKPLVGGKVYFGVQSADPIVSPQTIYSDRGFTTPISQPQILDANGRTTNKVWLKNRYSIRVDNLNDVQQYQELDNGESGSVGITTLDNVAGSNTITGTASPTISSYTDGETYVFKTVSINTGAVTLNWDSVGAKAVVKHKDQALEAGDFNANEIITVIYNETGDNFVWSNRDDVVDTPNFSLLNGILETSVDTNALTISIKTKAGTDPSVIDPVKVLFRNATAGTADITVLTISAATSFVVSSGSTLGATDATAFRLWIVGFNDGGTFRLGVINCLSGTNIFPLGGWPIASSTAEGGAGAADSAHVFYTGSAVTSKAYTVLGHAIYESGLTTAGTWDAVPTRMHLQTIGDPLPGDVIQETSVVDGALATGTGVIADDNTIPQNTEGDEYMTLAITPVSAANLLRIAVNAYYGGGASAQHAAAIFKDSDADAVACSLGAVHNTSSGNVYTFDHRRLAGTTVAQTYKFRMGGLTALTTTFNGSNGAAKFGGTMNSFMRNTEIMV